MSSFFAGPVGEMSKSKISIGRPRVVHALENISFLWEAGEDMEVRGWRYALRNIHNACDVALDWGTG